jgi:hypothetical protein
MLNFLSASYLLGEARNKIKQPPTKGSSLRETQKNKIHGHLTVSAWQGKNQEHRVYMYGPNYSYEYLYIME